MSVASHLGIETAEYDQQILTFIPHYDEILDLAAGALDAAERPVRTLLDLGTGSGALAARCLKRLGTARVVGIDSDPAMLAMAERRLGPRLTAVVGSFESTPFPPCDVVTAAFALHHIKTPAAKARVFRRVFAALRSGGLLIDADCHMPSAPRLLTRADDAWRAHLAATHGQSGARRFMRAWAGEDTYFTLELETRLLRRAGFTVDVVWRKDAFSVIAATKPRRA